MSNTVRGILPATPLGGAFYGTAVAIYNVNLDVELIWDHEHQHNAFAALSRHWKSAPVVTLVHCCCVQVDRAKVLSNTIKQKRKEKAGKWEVPLPKVRPIAEDEMFKVLKSGKRQKKAWKRMITKVTFVGPGFTRKPPKYERFIRPTGLRMTKAHVTHPELKATFSLEIIGVKKNPNGTTYTTLGVITKGTVIEVNVSELGLVTPGGKVVWGKYAQVTNNPENDGCINAVLLV